MDHIPEDSILEFHPDTLSFVRKQYNFDKPGQLDAAIDLLDDWIKKQNHFTKREFSREYLERTIILDKGSVERAKAQLDKLFTLKTLQPAFFEKYDARNDFTDLNGIYVHSLLPKLTKDHYRVYVGKTLENFSTNLFFSAFRFGTLFCEYTRAHDYCSGYVGILDYRGINVIELVTQLNVMEARQFVAILMEGYQKRVKGLHIITSSKAVEIFMKILKPMFSTKMGERIIVHSSPETLYEYVPKELLPTEFGGEERSLSKLNDEWIDVLSTKENIDYLKEMNTARTDETLRSTATFNEHYMGMAGTFKTLNVD